MNIAIDPRRCALVLVDYQERLLPAIHRGAEVVAEAARLADCARALDMRVIGTEQNPQGLGPNARVIRSRCGTTVAKMHFDGCADGLADVLRAPGRTVPSDVVIAGCETHVCLMQTAHGLQRAGFGVWVAANACGTRFPVDHDLALGRLRQSGAVLASVEMIAFEWLRTCGHERFKAVLSVLKAPRA
ncbi:MAG TPA: isochorismatase family protein [Usitatibacteraceae bacterium]|nr:isochorismatase family protein [Usitatibacteraceae bacterium]